MRISTGGINSKETNVHTYCVVMFTPMPLPCVSQALVAADRVFGSEINKLGYKVRRQGR